jgi:hypothetical protein
MPVLAPARKVADPGAMDLLADLDLAVRTDYGVLPGKPLCYRVTLPPAS